MSIVVADHDIRVVAFDLFGTLAHWDSPLLASPAWILARLAADDGVDLAHIAGLVEGVDGQRQYDPPNRAERDTAYRAWWRQAWRAAARHLGIEPTTEIEDLLTLAVQNRKLALYPDVMPALKSLGQMGIPWVLCSNSTPDALAKLSAMLPSELHPSEVLASCWVGARKPHRSMFEAVSEACGSPPEHVLFVGDRVDCDVDGPRSAGFLPVLLSRNGPLRPPPAALAVWRDLSPLGSGTDRDDG